MKEPKIVYVLSGRVDYEDYAVYGVYETLEDAQQVALTHPAITEIFGEGHAPEWQEQEQEEGMLGAWDSYWYQRDNLHIDERVLGQ